MLCFVEDVRVINHLDVLGVLAKLRDGVFDGDVRRNRDVASVHQAGGFIFGIEREPAAFSAALGDDGDFEVASLVKHLIGEIQATEPAFRGLNGGADENLGDGVFVRVIHQRVGAIFAVDDGGIDAEIFGEVQMPLDGLPLLRGQGGKFGQRANKNGDTGGVKIVRDAASAAQKHGGGGCRGNVDQNFLGV